MADIAASDLTYTVNSRGWQNEIGNVVNAKIVFGDGALTYPAGGVPLTSSKLGCPNGLQSLVMNETSAAVSTLWKWDQSANTLRGYVTSTAAELSGAVAAQEIHVTVTGF